MGLKNSKVKYVELPHTDATAVPKDVKKGKVFYNNDGRQVGDYEETLNVKTLSAIYGANVKEATFNKNNTGTAQADYLYFILMNGNGETISAGYGYEQYKNQMIAVSARRLIGVKFKGILHFAEFTSDLRPDGDGVAFIFDGPNHTEAKIYVIHKGQNIYIKVDSAYNETVTIYYI